MKPEQLYDHLAISPDSSDSAASFELAVASRRFSRRTKAVVDDKLSFSATLMRAGEVEAATRLLAEVERDVLDEEAALLERVNEVTVARTIARERITRGRLVRLLAVATVGSSLLAFSAAGMAVVGLFKNDPRTIQRGTEGIEARPTLAQRAVMRAEGTGDVRRVQVGGIEFQLTSSELREYRELASKGDEEGLENFLLSVLPTPLAERVHDALVTVFAAAPEPVEEGVVHFSHRANETREEVTEDEGEESSAEDDERDRSWRDRWGNDDDDDEPEPTPSPDESDDDGRLPFFDDDDEEEGGG
jgi:hypothetical protein